MCTAKVGMEANHMWSTNWEPQGEAIFTISEICFRSQQQPTTYSFYFISSTHYKSKGCLWTGKQEVKLGCTCSLLKSTSFSQISSIIISSFNLCVQALDIPSCMPRHSEAVSAPQLAI